MVRGPRTMAAKMFVLNSNITIGRFRLKPSEVKVKRSMSSFRDTATIKMPATARMVQAGEKVANIETAKAFNQGDKVTIELGYNGKLVKEFEGYVSRINFSTPVEVECEGYSYLLRKKSDYEKKTFVNVQLRDIIKFLCAGTVIVPAKNIPDFKVDKFIIDGRNGTEYLEAIKKLSHNTLVMFFEENILVVGMMYLQAADKKLNYLSPGKLVKYRLGWNVIKDNNLKLREAKNEQVTVSFIGEKKDGTKERKTIGKAGTEGETVTLKSHAVTDAGTINLMATAKHSGLSYDGYEGKITAFLQPFCAPNMVAQIIDKKYPERDGKYLVTAVEVTYGMSGARRIVQVGIKVSE